MRLHNFQFLFTHIISIIIVYSCFLGYVINRLTRTLRTSTNHQENISTSMLDLFDRSESSNKGVSTTRTLVIYVYGETHTSAPDNLAFFIRTAVRSSHDADYYFILQQMRNKVFDEKTLPPLPPNAHYLQHEDKCFDLGTIGWFLSSGKVDKTKYKYFIFLNSSVRGPFTVAYYHDPVWFSIFTRRLTDYIRLVGCTFNCDPSPHIQSYLWAMTPATYHFLTNTSKVFTCHKTFRGTIYEGEVAASGTLLHAGYGIESLMTKYRGLDLRASFMKNCPYGANPTPNRAVDGVTLDPYEVIFVKVKAGHHDFQNNLQRISAKIKIKPPMSRRNSSISFKHCLSFTILYTLFLVYLLYRLTRSSIQIACQGNMSTYANDLLRESKLVNDTTRTLVIYVYGETHASAPDNLAFFIRTAVRSSHDADYYFILQQMRNKVFDEKTLPPLPPNAHYLQHEDKCFDLGTIGWFLSSGRVDKTKYKYFIFLNSSIRGPFIVVYYDSPVWYTIFTRRLTDYIRLVGCTFSCEVHPHIQSYLWAMNLETLDFLLNNSVVFSCHRSMQKTIHSGEVAASRVILQAGFGIESLMNKYHSSDVRIDFMEKCAYQFNPTSNHVVDGITLDPYEVVFVKVKAGNPLYGVNLARALVYERWMAQ